MNKNSQAIGTISSSRVWHYPDSFGGGVPLGNDIASAKGTPIYAPGNGVVLYSSDTCPKDGHLGDTCGEPNLYGGGNQAILLVRVDGKLFAIIFAHMQYRSVLASATLIKAGDNIDRSAPSISFKSSNDGKTWSNVVSPVTLSINDSGSGVKNYTYYFSTDKGDYDEAKALSRGAYSNTISENTSSSWHNQLIRTINHPSNMAHNDVIYLHVKACDRSFSNNNCASAVYTTGIHFDNLAPLMASVNKYFQDWVNRFQLTTTANEFVQEGKHYSGLDDINLYFDNNDDNVHNEKHTNTTYDSLGLNASTCTTYSDKINLYNKQPGKLYRKEKTANYQWTIDFAKLVDVEDDGSENQIGQMSEGTRFIKIMITDIAGNISKPLLAVHISMM